MATILKPSKNAPIDRPCDLLHEGVVKAIVDAKTTLGPWAYLCEDHLRTHAAVKTADFVTNITTEDIDLEEYR